MIIELSKIAVSVAIIVLMATISTGFIIVGLFTIGVIPTIILFTIAYLFYIWLVLCGSLRRFWE